MSERFMIEMSSEEAQMWRRAAELTGQSVETLISRRLVPILPNEPLDEQIDNVASYLDEQLWTIVERPLKTEDEKSKWDTLIQRTKQGIHFPEEEQELDRLLELYDKRVLLRSEALVILQERGYDVKSYLKKNAPKK